MSLQFIACKNIYKNLTLEEKTGLFNELSFEERQLLISEFMKSSSTIGVCLPPITEKFKAWIVKQDSPYFNYNYTENDIMQAWQCWDYIFKYAKSCKKWGNLFVLQGRPIRDEKFIIDFNPVTKEQYFEYLLDNATPSNVAITTENNYNCFNKIREWFSIHSLSQNGFG